MIRISPYTDHLSDSHRLFCNTTRQPASHPVPCTTTTGNHTNQLPDRDPATLQQSTAISPFRRNRHPPEINCIPKARRRHVSGTAIDHRWMQPTQVSARSTLRAGFASIASHVLAPCRNMQANTWLQHLPIAASFRTGAYHRTTTLLYT